MTATQIPIKFGADAAAVPPALDQLPLPGGGRTWARWHALASVAADDLCAARVGEGHADAQAIIAELSPALERPAGTLGVWAAEAPVGGVVAEQRTDGSWIITGSRAWCSGATMIDHALVTAHAPDGKRLFLLPNRQPGVTIEPGTWPAVGMARTASLTVRFDGAIATAAIGGPGDYIERPGFWHGSMGVAACWYGGAVGVARTLRNSVEGRPDPHRLAHLGAVDSLLVAMATSLRATAVAVDADPLDRSGDAQLMARRLRAQIEDGCEEVLARTGRATGASPLCLDAPHARRVADLTVYLRQSHAEVDLAVLGEMVVDRGDDDWLPTP